MERTKSCDFAGDACLEQETRTSELAIIDGGGGGEIGSEMDVVRVRRGWHRLFACVKGCKVGSMMASRCMGSGLVDPSSLPVELVFIEIPIYY